MKVSDQQLLESYVRHSSFQLVADEFGLSRSGVHLRLKAAGYKPSFRRLLTDDDKGKIEALYTAGFNTGDGQLDALCESIGHNKDMVSLYASRAGLAMRSRKGAKWKRPAKPPKEPRPYVHPRGMLGKKHSPEVCAQMSITRAELAKNITQEQWTERTAKGMKTKIERYGSIAAKPEHTGRTWKSAWREIGGQRKYYRSRWEANYARVLQWRLEQGMIAAWQHEPETFWFLEIKRGVRSYLPDFKVTYSDGRIEYHEVKGWMCDRSRTTLARMAKYHPEIKIVLIEADWFKANKNFRIVLKDWE